ncbi:MAG: response regulator [Phycisphaeraceae bacterium]|nr:response regulator [Phycisphaerales bacterium]MCB9860105.1 response regulator [Phycisphaeraceae bacterium]
MAFEKDVLTTGEVAKICNVAPRTVSKWFDNGSLKGYRIPGSKDRRIPVAELIEFMKAHGMPLNGLKTGSTRVLIADTDSEMLDVLTKVLREQTSYDVSIAKSGFEAGMMCHQVQPHVLLIDVHMDSKDLKTLCESIRNDEQLQLTRIIAMSGQLTDGQTGMLRSVGFDGFLRKPFQVRQLVEAIENATQIVS